MTVLLPLVWAAMFFIAPSVPGDEYWPVGVALGPFVVVLAFAPLPVAAAIAASAMVLLGRHWDRRGTPWTLFCGALAAGVAASFIVVALFDLEAPKNTGHPVWYGVVMTFYGSLLAFSFVPRSRSNQGRVSRLALGWRRFTGGDGAEDGPTGRRPRS